MKKNGSTFLAIVDAASLKSGIWDPYCYREKTEAETLGHFVTVQRLKAATLPRHAFKYAPIEYRHISRGNLPVFMLEPSGGGLQTACQAVGENALLFGTMRAYLGNVLVTPKAAWIGEKSPYFFAVKSEFVQIAPKDGLVFFWWAYLQTQSFLHSLPLGTGGTRPRLNPASMAQTPVEVPLREVREHIHKQFRVFASRLWTDYVAAEQLLETTLG